MEILLNVKRNAGNKLSQLHKIQTIFLCKMADIGLDACHIVKSFFPGAFVDNIAGALLRLHIDFADILRDNAEGNKLYATDKADNTGHARPAGDCLAAERCDKCPKAADKAYQCNNYTKGHD